MISPAESAGELIDVSEPAEQSPHDSQLDAWDATTGNFLPGFPQVMDSLQFFDQPIVADLTGSRGKAYAVEASSDSDLRAFDALGQEAPGFPKLTGGWVTGGAAFGTLGSLADQVLVAGTREGELFIWQTGAPACGPSGVVAPGPPEPLEHRRLLWRLVRRWRRGTGGDRGGHSARSPPHPPAGPTALTASGSRP